MPSRRAVLASVAAVGLAGCSSIAEQIEPIDTAATGKRIDASVDGEWRTVARCEPAQGYSFEYEAVPVEVPLAVERGEAARGEGTPSPDLSEEGPLVVRGSLFDELREAYDLLRYGLALTAIEENEVHDRAPGTETTYWIARGTFNRVLVGDRVAIRPSENDPRGIESIANVSSVRPDSR